MRFKGTLVLLLLFVALGGYVYFAEYRGADERQKQEEEKKKVFPVEGKDVQELTLEYPDLTVSAVRKGEKQWEISSPAGLEADSEQWEMLASNLGRIERGDVVVTGPSDLAQYGLAQPAIKVTARMADSRILSVAFGGENPQKTNSYAKLGDKDEVFLSANSWTGLFRKSLTDLRNKKVLDFDADNIDSVSIVTAAQDLQFQKSGTDWNFKKPAPMADSPADGSELSSLLSTLQFAQASDFAEIGLDAKAAGFDAPPLKIVLHDAQAGKDHSLLVGKPAPADRYYARDEARPAIFLIGKDILDRSRKTVFDWRDKAIGRLNTETVDEVEIARGSEVVLLKKAGEGWQAADGRKVNQPKMSDILQAPLFDRALEILDSPKSLAVYGLDNPKIRVSYRQAGIEALNVALGGDNKNPAGVYVKVSSRPVVMTAGTEFFEKFSVLLADLLESPPPTPEPAK